MSMPLKIALVAFALRACMAVLTHFQPIFPEYYYNDALMFDETSWQLARFWAGEAPPISAQVAYLSYQKLIASIYYVLGHQPLVPQFLNAVFGAWAAYALTHLGLLLFAVRIGRIGNIGSLAGWIFAFWPSCIFFNSQLLKGNLVLALVFTSLWLLTLAMDPSTLQKKSYLFLMTACVLLLIGFSGGMSCYLPASLFR